MTNIPVGEVAVRSKSRRTLRHLMNPNPTITRTACGRYPVERILPEDEPIGDDTPMCQVCQAIEDGTNDYRWRSGQLSQPT